MNGWQESLRQRVNEQILLWDAPSLEKYSKDYRHFSPGSVDDGKNDGSQSPHVYGKRRGHSSLSAYVRHRRHRVGHSISLVPKVPWSQWIVSFPSWEEAANGDLLVFGIPVILFKNEERLNRLMARCEEIGIGVANPHIWDMQEGGRSYSHDRLWDLERSFKPVKPEEAGGSVLRASYLLQDDTIRSSIVIFISGVLRMSRSSVCFGGVVVERKQPCTLRDGTVLYADIYRPDEPEKEYPVLLMRQPYGRAIASTVSHAHPLWYAQHGYIVVIQDVRGREIRKENSFLLSMKHRTVTMRWSGRRSCRAQPAG